MGKARAAVFERLYLLPGVHHCGGGEGPSLVDFLTPVMDWVEKGAAPEAVVTRSGGPVVRSRPVYPHPAIAQYDGQGDPTAAASYGPGAPLVTAAAPDWAGADFYTPWDH
jgi:feruloyl esterase